MKENSQLSEVLAEWRITPTQNPQFRTRVRARIDTPASVQWMAYLRANLAPCAVAASLILTAGAWLGHMQAEREVQKDREILAAAYLASIDARYQEALQDRR